MGVVNEKNNTMRGFDVLKQDIFKYFFELLKPYIDPWTEFDRLEFEFDEGMDHLEIRGIQIVKGIKHFKSYRKELKYDNSELGYSYCKIYNTTHNLISDKIEVNTGKNYLGRITIDIIDQSIFKEV